jgi:hypothetical protein
MNRVAPMKFRGMLLAHACAASCLLLAACVEYVPEAGNGAGPPPPPPAPPAAAPVPPRPGDARLDALLAPIALYPDPLLALILPASTRPAEISAAAAYLVQYGDATRIDSQPWDASVRALAHYPTVVTWMADNLAWTQALGDAFSSSPSDVMESIQRLRERAMVSGALAPSAQVQVASEDGEIEILPAQPDAIIVPAYDADLVFADGPYYGPPIFLGPAFPAGIWLSYFVDWHHRSVWDAGTRAQRSAGGWYDPRRNGGRPPDGARPWQPPSGAPQSGPPRGASVPHPSPMPGAPGPAPRQREANPAAGQQRGELRPQAQGAVAPPAARAATPEHVREPATPARQEPASGKASPAGPTTEPKDREQPH